MDGRELENPVADHAGAEWPWALPRSRFAHSFCRSLKSRVARLMIRAKGTMATVLESSTAKGTGEWGRSCPNLNA
jgi:hypothetical protein